MTRYLTPQQVAEQIQVREKTLANWRYLGRGPAYVKEGGLVRYSTDAVDAWAAEHTVEPRP